MTINEKLVQLKNFLNLGNHKPPRGIKWTSVECMNDADFTHGGDVNDVVQEIGRTVNYDPMEDYVDIQMDNGYITYSSGPDHDNFLEFCDKCMMNNIEFIVCSHEFHLNPERKAKLKEMYDKGIIFICAAGNKGEKFDLSTSSRALIFEAEYTFPVTSFYLDEKGKMRWGGHNYGEDIKIIAPTYIPIDKDEDKKLDDSFYGTSSSAPCQMEIFRICKGINPNIDSKTLSDFIEYIGKDITFNKYTYKYITYNEEKTKLFMNDVKTETTNDWKKEFKDSWDKAVRLKVIDGTRPNDTLTRNEFIVILDRLKLLK